MARTKESIARRRTEALAAAERYAERELRPRLGWGASPAPLSIPEAGLRSLVYLAAPREGMASVIHAFNDDRERSKLRRALALNAAGDLPIPKLLHAGWGLAERMRYGFSFVAAELAPGKLISELPYSDEMMRAVGRALAQLHASTSLGWGPPPGRWGSPLAEHLRESYEKRFEELKKLNGKIDGELARKAAARMRAEWAKIEEAAEEWRPGVKYRLCHHHLAPDDALYDAPSGRVTFVDCASLVYSDPGRDLAMARLTIADCDEAKWRVMLKGYAETAGQEETEKRCRWMTFFTLFVLIGKWRNHAGDAQRRGEIEREIRATTD